MAAEILYFYDVKIYIVPKYKNKMYLGTAETVKFFNDYHKVSYRNSFYWLFDYKIEIYGFDFCECNNEESFKNIKFDLHIQENDHTTIIKNLTYKGVNGLCLNICSK